MKNADLRVLQNELIIYLRTYQYSKTTLLGYQQAFDLILAKAPQNEDFELDELIKNLQEKITFSLKKPIFDKALRQLCEFNQKHELSFSPQRKSDLNDYYSAIVNGLINFKDFKQITRKTCRYYARVFCRWLQGKNIQPISEVTDSTLKQYFLYCTQRMQRNSLSTTRYYLALFFQYLVSVELINDDFSQSFSFPVVVNRTIQKPASPSEIALVLRSIDRTTPTGKRDYALFMIAIATGLREGDIANLKLLDIDWKNGVINICQGKTGKNIAIPLTKDYASAIQDYILNARPQVNSEYVFLRRVAPIKEITGSAISSQYRLYRLKCGLQPEPFHSIRRMVGSSVLSGGTGIDLIPDILGHSSIESSKPYLYMHTDKMKECSLSLELIPAMPEV